MGLVYKANDSLLNITVAVKKLHQYDSDTIVRFQNEAVALGKLNHRNIAKILDFASDTDSLYMVMEFLDGRSLAEVIKEEQLSPEEAVQLFIDIAEAMAHAHKNCVLHRDLKPSNIIIVEHENGERIPKIVDFGIAKIGSSDQRLTATGVGIGSPLYMSPEQARNENVDERSDIYSFACLMFETLTGQPPLKGASTLETIQKQLEEQPPRVDEIKEELNSNKRLVELIDKCLQKNAGDRLQNFSQVQKELQVSQLEGDHSLEHASENDQEKNTRSPSRVYWIALPLLAVFLVLVFATQFNNFTNQSEEGKQTRVGSKKSSKRKSSTLEHVIPVVARVRPERLECKGALSRDSLRRFRGDKVLEEIKIVDNCSTGNILNEFVQSPIRTIEIVNCEFSDADLASLENFDSLDYLILLKLSSITNDGMRNLTRLKKLKHLEIDRCEQLTDSFAVVVPELEKLEALALTGFSFSDSILPYLAEARTLKHLELGDTKVTAERLSKFVSQKKSLRRLAVNEQELSDQLLREIGRSNIESLDFAGSLMTRPQLEMMVDNSHISSLGLQAGNPFSKELTATPLLDTHDYSTLQRCKALKALTLYKVRSVSDEAIDAIARLKVEELKFETCNITDKQLLRLAPMKMLKKLDLFRAGGASDAGVAELKKRLDEKWNRNCQITFLSEEQYQIKYHNK